MGLMQRRKGRAFEQDIARRLRAKWPSVDVLRGQQGNGAWNSDVYITGQHAPELLTRIWWELQDAAKPTPRAKLEQAERDHRPGTLPVVVWHKLRERDVWVTCRLGTLLEMTGFINFGPDDIVVTLELHEFLRLVDVATVGQRRAA